VSWSIYGTPTVASPAGTTRGVNARARLDSDLDTSDLSCSITVVTMGDSSRNYVGARVRVSPIDETCYVAVLSGSGEVTIEAMDATGTLTALATSATPVSVTTPGVLRAEVDGDQIRGYWNDELAVTATDSTIPEGARVGL